MNDAVPPVGKNIPVAPFFLQVRTVLATAGFTPFSRLVSQGSAWFAEAA
jgi:hypothetical protein